MGEFVNDQVKVSNNGLKAEMEMDSSPMSPFQDLEPQDHPAAWFCSLLVRARGETWLDERFVLAQCRALPGSSPFIISIQFTFNETLHSYMSTVINNKDTDTLVWITEVSYMGEKILELHDILYSSDRTELGHVKMVYGLVDLQRRMLIGFPEKVTSKVSLIPHNVKPPRVEVKQPLPEDDFNISKSVVGPDHIDTNNHANVTYYIGIAIQALKHFNRVDLPNTRIKSFTLLCKNETVLGDQVVTKAWGTGENHTEYFCETTKDDILVSFVHATYSGNVSAKL